MSASARCPFTMSLPPCLWRSMQPCDPQRRRATVFRSKKNPWLCAVAAPAGKLSQNLSVEARLASPLRGPVMYSGKSGDKDRKTSWGNLFPTHRVPNLSPPQIVSPPGPVFDVFFCPNYTPPHSVTDFQRKKMEPYCIKIINDPFLTIIAPSRRI